MIRKTGKAVPVQRRINGPQETSEGEDSSEVYTMNFG